MHVRPGRWLSFVIFVFSAATAFAQSAGIADLAVTKNGLAAAAAGTDVAYNVLVNNFGPDDAWPATLTDPIPAGMTFVSLSQSGPTFSCTTPIIGAGGTITCTIVTLTSGSSTDFTIALHIPPATPPSTSFTNTATVSTTTFDPTSENDSSTTTTWTPSNNADVAVTKTGPSEALPNAYVAYTITVQNNGPAAAANVALIDTLPAGMTFVSLSQSGPAFNCTTPSIGAGGTVNCSIVYLANGASATFTLTARTPNVTGNGKVFTNAASVVATSHDQNPENDSSAAGTTVSSSIGPLPSYDSDAVTINVIPPDVSGAVDLAITKTASAPPYKIGFPITYTIVVTNAGPASAIGVTVTDVIPPGTTFTSTTSSQGNCSGTTTVTCALGTIASGGLVTISLVLTLPSTSGSLHNTATVTTLSPDTNPANNSGTATITIDSVASIFPLTPWLVLLVLTLLIITGVVAMRRRLP